MQASLYHLNELPARPTRARQSRVILSELPRGEYLVPSAPCAINLVLQGEEIYDIAGQRLRVGAGEMLLTLPGRAMRVTLTAPYNRALCVCLPSMPLQARPLVMSARTSLLGRFLSDTGSTTALDPAALIADVSEALPAFARDLHDRLGKVSAIKAATRQRLLQRLERACAAMHDVVTRQMPLAALAEIAGMSTHHFARSFAAVYGLPPGRFHQRLRIEAAARALHSGSVTPAEAALQFGFADQASFSRAFRRQLGSTPGSWARASAVN